jgi:hypothetical protein
LPFGRFGQIQAFFAVGGEEPLIQAGHNGEESFFHGGKDTILLKSQKWTGARLRKKSLVIRSDSNNYKDESE